MKKNVGSFTHKVFESNANMMTHAIELFNKSTIERLSKVVAKHTAEDFKDVLKEKKFTEVQYKEKPIVDPFGRATHFSIEFGNHSIPVFQPGTIAALSGFEKNSEYAIKKDGALLNDAIIGQGCSLAIAEFCQKLAAGYRHACSENNRKPGLFYQDLLHQQIRSTIAEFEILNNDVLAGRLTEYDPVFRDWLTEGERALLFSRDVKIFPELTGKSLSDTISHRRIHLEFGPILHMFTYLPNLPPLPLTALFVSKVTAAIIDKHILPPAGVHELNNVKSQIIKEISNHHYISQHLGPIPEKPEYIQLQTPIGEINAEEAFGQLESKEKLYSYYMSRASWEGAKICYFQRSYESPVLCYIFGKIFTMEDYDALKMRTLENKLLTNDEWEKLIAYIAGVFNNCGNYLSYGDKKFLPEISDEQFWKWIQSTTFYKSCPNLVNELLYENLFEIYEHRAPYGHIGFKDKSSVNSYFSSNCTSHDSDLINEFLKHIHFCPLNTFAVKLNDSNYRILVCSASKPPSRVVNYKGARFEIEYGYLDTIMRRMNGYMREALKYVANDNQKKMIEAYIEHFENGNIEEHKNSQRWWIKDVNPSIETNIGFVETYLDPAGVRAEWEGFVSIVDKKQSQLLVNLVQNAEKVIETLPWGKLYEKDKFLRPDFTSLLVVTFASSGTPIGINIPNYDDIRMNEGFKNVNLGNVAGTPKRENINHLPEDYKDFLILHDKESLFVDVSCHELLGHGTGKLFTKNQDGTFNFDPKEIEGFDEKTTPHYSYNDTWSSRFGNISSSWEESRAECVAMYLACNQTVLETLVPGRADIYDHIIKSVWIGMVYGGIKGMIVYSPDNKAWGQAHCQARYAIYKVLREHGFIDVKFEDKEGKDYFYFKMKIDKIKTEGIKIIGDFLKQLQVMKSHGDIEKAKVFWEKYTSLNDEELRMRRAVIAWRKPRPLEVQAELKLNGEKVDYIRFPETFEGIVKSFIGHYQGEFDNVNEEYQKYKYLFRPGHLDEHKQEESN
jgi:dipeptidyl-peptidase-3